MTLALTHPLILDRTGDLDRYGMRRDAFVKERGHALQSAFAKCAGTEIKKKKKDSNDDFIVGLKEGRAKSPQSLPR